MPTDTATRLPAHVKRIRELNDNFRRTGEGGLPYPSDKVKAAGSAFLAAALRAIASFDAFTEEQDPSGERQGGMVEVEGEKVFFQINYYYDRNMGNKAPNPANPSTTQRTLFISFQPIPFS